MRHGLRELSGHASGRRHRVLPGGNGAALAVESCHLARVAIARNPSPSWPCLSRPAAPSGAPGKVADQPKRSTSMKGPTQRQLRVGELIRHIMAEMLARGDVHDPVIEGRLITVPEVRMSADL